MKLKTTLKKGSLDRTGSVGTYFGNCEHDAAYAHALVKALAFFEDGDPQAAEWIWLAPLAPFLIVGWAAWHLTHWVFHER